MNSTFRRWTSGLTLAAFCFTQTGIAMPAYAASELQGGAVPAAFRVEVPADLGTIDFSISGTGPSIIHLQTAHGNFEAQKKIQSLLQHFHKTYGLNTLYLEGADRGFDGELLRIFPKHMKENMTVLDKLTEKALVKGPELFLAETNTAAAEGIEETALYQENLEAFRTVIREREASSQFLSGANVQIERLAATYLSDDLRSFISRIESFENKKTPLENYLTELREAARKQLGVDLGHPVQQIDWPMLYRIYTLKEITARLDLSKFPGEKKEFLGLIRGIDPEIQAKVKAVLDTPLTQPWGWDTSLMKTLLDLGRAMPKNVDVNRFPNVNRMLAYHLLHAELKGSWIFFEVRKLAEKISESMTSAESERAILKLLDEHRLLKKLFALELTPEDWKSVQEKGESLKPSSLLGRFLKLNTEKRVRDLAFDHLAEMDRLFDAAVNFYELVNARDGAMLKNIDRLLESEKDKTVVIVTGGFHTGPFEDHFAQSGRSYSLIMPKLTATTDKDLEKGRALYEQVVFNRFSEIKKSTVETPDFNTQARTNPGFRDAVAGTALDAANDLAMSRSEVRAALEVWQNRVQTMRGSIGEQTEAMHRAEVRSEVWDGEGDEYEDLTGTGDAITKLLSAETYAALNYFYETVDGLKIRLKRSTPGFEDRLEDVFFSPLDQQTIVDALFPDLPVSRTPGQPQVQAERENSLRETYRKQFLVNPDQTFGQLVRAIKSLQGREEAGAVHRAEVRSEVRSSFARQNTRRASENRRELSGLRSSAVATDRAKHDRSEARSSFARQNARRASENGREQSGLRSSSAGFAGAKHDRSEVRSEKLASERVGVSTDSNTRTLVTGSPSNLKRAEIRGQKAQDERKLKKTEDESRVESNPSATTVDVTRFFDLEDPFSVKLDSAKILRGAPFTKLQKHSRDTGLFINFYHEVLFTDSTTGNRNAPLDRRNGFYASDRKKDITNSFEIGWTDTYQTIYEWGILRKFKASLGQGYEISVVGKMDGETGRSNSTEMKILLEQTSSSEPLASVPLIDKKDAVRLDQMEWKRVGKQVELSIKLIGKKQLLEHLSAWKNIESKVKDLKVSVRGRDFVIEHPEIKIVVSLRSEARVKGTPPSGRAGFKANPAPWEGVPLHRSEVRNKAGVEVSLSREGEDRWDMIYTNDGDTGVIKITERNGNKVSLVIRGSVGEEIKRSADLGSPTEIQMPQSHAILTLTITDTGKREGPFTKEVPVFNIQVKFERWYQGQSQDRRVSVLRRGEFLTIFIDGNSVRLNTDRNTDSMSATGTPAYELYDFLHRHNISSTTPVLDRDIRASAGGILVAANQITIGGTYVYLSLSNGSEVSKLVTAISSNLPLSAELSPETSATATDRQAKPRSEVRADAEKIESLRIRLVEALQLYADYLSEGDDLGAKGPDVFLVLGQPDFKTYLEFISQWKTFAEKARKIPVVLAGGRGRGTVALAQNILNHYGDRLSAEDRAFFEAGITNEAITEAKMLQKVFQIEAPEMDVRLERQASTNTQQNFDYSMEVVEEAVKGVDEPSVAIVTRPELLRRAFQNASQSWIERNSKKWKLLRSRVYAQDLSQLSLDELVFAAAYVAGYPSRLLTEIDAKLNPKSELDGIRDGGGVISAEAWHQLEAVRKALDEVFSTVAFNYDSNQRRFSFSELRKDWRENKLSPEDEAYLEEVYKALNIHEGATIDGSKKSEAAALKDQSDRFYIRSMYFRHLYQPMEGTLKMRLDDATLAGKVILQDGLTEDEINAALKDGNFVLGGILSAEQKKKYMGSISLEELKSMNDEKGGVYEARAQRDVSLTANPLDGGIGESVGRILRLEYWTLVSSLSDILNTEGTAYEAQKLEMNQATENGDVKRMMNILRKLQADTGRPQVTVTLGAKGTDLVYQVTIGKKKVSISIAENRLLDMIDQATAHHFAGLAFEPLVNYQSIKSYEDIFNKPYVMDVIAGADKPRTYAQVFAELGIGNKTPIQQLDLPKFQIKPGELRGKPTLDVKGKGKTQPGGHGQWGVFFFLFFSQTAPPSDGKVHINRFLNGDNPNSFPSALIAGYVAEERKAIVKLTTAATLIDKKGGKDGLTLVAFKENGVVKLAYVPDMLEEIEAKQAGQVEQFYEAGQVGSRLGKPGAQPFNTNIFYFNRNVLYPILHEIRQIVGDAEFFTIASPTLFDKRAKATRIGDDDYVSMDGAIGYVVHNLNTFYMTDPRLKDLRAKHGDRLLWYVDVPRDYFAPVKEPGDVWLQAATDFYHRDETSGRFIFSNPSAQLPGLSFEDSWVNPEKIVDGKPEKKDSKFWQEILQWEILFGGAKVQELQSLKVRGRVVVRNAKFAGRVEILNKKGSQHGTKQAEQMNLRDPNYLAVLSKEGYYRDGQLDLKDVKLTIQEDGTLTIERLSPVRSEVRNKAGVEVSLSREGEDRWDILYRNGNDTGVIKITERNGNKVSFVIRGSAAEEIVGSANLGEATEIQMPQSHAILALTITNTGKREGSFTNEVPVFNIQVKFERWYQGQSQDRRVSVLRRGEFLTVFIDGDSVRLNTDRNTDSMSATRTPAYELYDFLHRHNISSTTPVLDRDIHALAGGILVVANQITIGGAYVYLSVSNGSEVSRLVTAISSNLPLSAELSPETSTTATDRQAKPRSEVRNETVGDVLSRVLDTEVRVQNGLAGEFQTVKFRTYVTNATRLEGLPANLGSFRVRVRAHSFTLAQLLKEKIEDALPGYRGARPLKTTGSGSLAGQGGNYSFDIDFIRSEVPSASVTPRTPVSSLGARSEVRVFEMMDLLKNATRQAKEITGTYITKMPRGHLEVEFTLIPKQGKGNHWSFIYDSSRGSQSVMIGWKAGRDEEDGMVHITRTIGGKPKLERLLLKAWTEKGIQMNPFVGYKKRGNSLILQFKHHPLDAKGEPEKDAAGKLRVEIYEVELKGALGGKKISKKARAVQGESVMPPSDFESLGFDSRTVKALLDQKIDTVGKFLEKTEQDLIKMRGFGSKRTNEIIEKLLHKNLALKGHPNILIIEKRNPRKDDPISVLGLGKYESLFSKEKNGFGTVGDLLDASSYLINRVYGLGPEGRKSIAATLRKHGIEVEWMKESRSELRAAAGVGVVLQRVLRTPVSIEADGSDGPSSVDPSRFVTNLEELEALPAGAPEFKVEIMTPQRYDDHLAKALKQGIERALTRYQGKVVLTGLDDLESRYVIEFTRSRSEVRSATLSAQRAELRRMSEPQGLRSAAVATDRGKHDRSEVRVQDQQVQEALAVLKELLTGVAVDPAKAIPGAGIGVQPFSKLQPVIVAINGKDYAAAVALLQAMRDVSNPILKNKIVELLQLLIKDPSNTRVFAARVAGLRSRVESGVLQAVYPRSRAFEGRLVSSRSEVRKDTDVSETTMTQREISKKVKAAILRVIKDEKGNGINEKVYARGIFLRMLLVKDLEFYAPQMAFLVKKFETLFPNGTWYASDFYEARTVRDVVRIVRSKLEARSEVRQKFVSVLEHPTQRPFSGETVQPVTVDVATTVSTETGVAVGGREVILEALETALGDDSVAVGLGRSVSNILEGATKIRAKAEAAGFKPGSGASVLDAGVLEVLLENPAQLADFLQMILDQNQASSRETPSFAVLLPQDSALTPSLVGPGTASGVPAARSDLPQLLAQAVKSKPELAKAILAGKVFTFLQAAAGQTQAELVAELSKGQTAGVSLVSLNETLVSTGGFGNAIPFLMPSAMAKKANRSEVREALSYVAMVSKIVADQVGTKATAEEISHAVNLLLPSVQNRGGVFVVTAIERVLADVRSELRAARSA